MCVFGLSEPHSFNTLICLIASKMICMISSVLCLLMRLYELVGVRYFRWFFPGSVKPRLTYRKLFWHLTKLASKHFQINFSLRTLNSDKKTEIKFAQSISWQKESQWISQSCCVTLSWPTIFIDDDDNKIDIARNFSHRPKKKK